MTYLIRLKACQDLTDLARLLRIKPRALAYIAYIMPDSSKYKQFNIPKAAGGSRLILAPTPRLKFVQRRLSEVLYQCLGETEAHIKDNCWLAHGFRRGRSIASNAEKHKNRKYVVNLDLENFFDNINFGRVRGFLISNQNFQLHPKVATVIAQVACFNNALPQGSPSSPVISNLIGHLIDIRLNALATEERCTYTRYVDDITLSTNEKYISPRLMRFDNNEASWVASKKLRGELNRLGFSFNATKTRVQFRTSRQEVTGLTVNKFVNVTDNYYKYTRAMTYNLLKRGSCHSPSVEKGVSGKRILSPEQLQGRIAFIFRIKGTRVLYKRFSDKQNMPNFYKLYGDYLNYIYFYNNLKPTLVCEGETDNIYIKHALQALSSKFLLLSSSAKGGPSKVKFFNYTPATNATQLLGGGTGDIANLIYRYKSIIRTIKAPASLHPVIVITDNDLGAKPIFSAIKNIKKLSLNVTGTEKFYHVIDNLYIVPIPTVAGVNTTIEDLFEKSVLAKTLSGKTFHANEKTFDSSKHYGKKAFARNIIQKDYNSINFSNFEQLFVSITLAINHYYGSVQTGLIAELNAR